MVASSLAVAGMEPVEPAAMIGLPGRDARRAASAAIRRSRRAAGSMAPRSARMPGPTSRAIKRSRRIDAQLLEKRIADQPAGAARRQEYSLVRKIERPRRETVHQPTLAQRAYQRRQKRRRRRNGEHARGRGRRPYASLLRLRGREG